MIKRIHDTNHTGEGYIGGIKWENIIAYKDAAPNGIIVSIDAINEKILPVSEGGTDLDKTARIAGELIPPNIDKTTAKYICQDCHVKAWTKAPARDEKVANKAKITSEKPVKAPIILTPIKVPIIPNPILATI